MESKEKLKKKEKVTNKIKIRNRYYEQELVTKDTFTNEMELISKLTPFINLDNKLAYTSSPIYIQIEDKEVPVCSSIIDKYREEFITHPKKKEVLDTIFYRAKPNNNRYSPSNKLYKLEEINYKLPEYLKIDNNLSFLDKYTFGFELETSNSLLTDTFSAEHGFAALYDGSIQGPELVSDVMKYDNFHYLHRFLKVVKKYSRINDQCSFHIHIGNVNYDERTLFALYNLFQRLQDELNKIIAPYRKDWNYIANKGKDHCRDLPRLPEDSIKDLYKLLEIDKIVSTKNNELLEQYIKNTKKWDAHGRYFNVNFLNYICKKPQQKTVEIRSLQMTYNFDYILTWLFINTSIIHFAENNVDLILNRQKKIQLKDCIDSFIPEDLRSTLYSNIQNLTTYFHDSYYLKNNHLRDLESLEENIDATLKSYKIYKELDYTKSITKVLNNLDYYKLKLIKKTEIDIESYNCYYSSIKFDGNLYMYLRNAETNITSRILTSFHDYSIIMSRLGKVVDLKNVRGGYFNINAYWSSNRESINYQFKNEKENRFIINNDTYLEKSTIPFKSGEFYDEDTEGLYNLCLKQFTNQIDLYVNFNYVGRGIYTIFRVSSDMFLINNQFPMCISKQDITDHLDDYYKGNWNARLALTKYYFTDADLIQYTTHINRGILDRSYHNSFIMYIENIAKRKKEASKPPGLRNANLYQTFLSPNDDSLFFTIKLDDSEDKPKMIKSKDIAEKRIAINIENENEDEEDVEDERDRSYENEF